MKNTKEYNKIYYEFHKRDNHLSQTECDLCGKLICLLALKKHKLSIKCQFKALKNQVLKDKDDN